jgi:hypothetical protein
MGAIRLNSNVWINCLYASVSMRFESMIGYIADLGECLYDARIFTCYTHIYMMVSHVWVVSIRCGDAVNRTRIRVVSATCMYIWGICICGSK